MSYRPIQRILVPTDVSGYSESAALRACEIAHAHLAQVTGLMVLDTPEIAGCVPPGELTYWPIIHDTIENLTSDARERIASARGKFSAICDEKGVTHSAHQLEGVPSSKILEASGLFDLVVMGLRTYFHFETREGPGDSLSQVLGRTVTPVLAVPQREDRNPTAFKKVTIAYDGSFGASRSIRDFVAFARPYDFEITIATAHEEASQANHLLESAATYLRAHNIEQFDTIHIPSPELSATGHPAIDEADLVVTGIHARHILKDIFVGSFTSRMIDRGDIALFMSH